MKKKIVALGLVLIAVSAAAVASVSAYIDGGWPETCLEMNDMVEASPLGSGAVGIYQRAFGDQAEQACRNDHRDDVRRAFAWAIGGPSEPVQAPPPYSYNVQATDLAREFDTNERAANEKYMGKLIRVTGVVDDVQQGGFFGGDDWHLDLDATYGRNTFFANEVDCRFMVRHEGWLGNVTPGQSVAVSGYVTGYSSDLGVRIVLKDCGPA